MVKCEDILGAKFGRLEIVGYKYGGRRGARTTLLCLCDCGRAKSGDKQNIIRGRIKSCGCLQAEVGVESGKKSRTHGLTKSKAYRTWIGIRRKCSDQTRKHYGARGITVCKRWARSFENFLADMGNPPTTTHSIDRIDVNGNYEPGNCRWATRVEQMNNRRVNVFIEVKGERMTISMASRRYGVPKTTISQRLKRGLTAEKAVGL